MSACRIFPSSGGAGLERSVERRDLGERVDAGVRATRAVHLDVRAEHVAAGGARACPGRSWRSPATASRGTARRRIRVSRGGRRGRSRSHCRLEPAILPLLVTSETLEAARPFTRARDAGAEARTAAGLRALVSALEDAAGDAWAGAALGGALGRGEGATLLASGRERPPGRPVRDPRRPRRARAGRSRDRAPPREGRRRDRARTPPPREGRRRRAPRPRAPAADAREHGAPRRAADRGRAGRSPSAVRRRLPRRARPLRRRASPREDGRRAARGRAARRPVRDRGAGARGAAPRSGRRPRARRSRPDLGGALGAGGRGARGGAPGARRGVAGRAAPAGLPRPDELDALPGPRRDGTGPRPRRSRRPADRRTSTPAGRSRAPATASWRSCACSRRSASAASFRTGPSTRSSLARRRSGAAVSELFGEEEEIEDAAGAGRVARKSARSWPLAERVAPAAAALVDWDPGDLPIVPVLLDLPDTASRDALRQRAIAWGEGA